MLSNNNNNLGRQYERYSYSQYAVSDSGRTFLNRMYQGISPQNQRNMATKILIWLFYGVGLPSYISSCAVVFGFINISDAKAFILFVLGTLFMTARLIVYCVENYQKYKFRQKKLNEKSKSL